LPIPFSSSSLQTADLASDPYNPSKPSNPEFTIHPKSTSADFSSESAATSSFITKTLLIGMPYFFAKSKSLSS